MIRQRKMLYTEAHAFQMLKIAENTKQCSIKKQEFVQKLIISLNKDLKNQSNGDEKNTSIMKQIY